MLRGQAPGSGALRLQLYAVLCILSIVYKISALSPFLYQEAQLDCVLQLCIPFAGISITGFGIAGYTLSNVPDTLLRTG